MSTDALAAMTVLWSMLHGVFPRVGVPVFGQSQGTDRRPLLIGDWVLTEKGQPSGRNVKRLLLTVVRQRGSILQGRMKTLSSQSIELAFEGTFERRILKVVYHNKACRGTLRNESGAYILDLQCDGSFQGKKVGLDQRTNSVEVWSCQLTRA